jgi:Fic family protein
MIKYDRKNPFNELPLLPPPESIIDMEVLLKWGYASRALAEFNKNILRLPNPHMLINTISLQEAKSSSEIENIFTTEDELYKAISQTVKEESTSIKEVLRYREALWAGYKQITKSKKIDEKAIIKIFKQVKNSNEGIRPPQSLVVIKRGQSEHRSGEIIYTPPRGKGVVENKLKNLVLFLNDNKKYPIDPLLKMIIGHYQFEAIHPFSDGNGRTGRIINLLYLVNQNLLSHPVLYLSKYIIENKEDYYFKLGAVTQRKAWKPWLLFMLEAVEQTAKHSNGIIDDIILQMESTHKYAKTKIKWHNKDVNELLFSQPYIKAKTIGEAVGKTSRTTITKYMGELVKHGILSSKTEGKEVYYLNNDLLRILKS